VPGGGEDGPIAVETVAGAYELCHVTQTGGGVSAKLPAVAARVGSGSALFEYHDTIPSLCDVRGSVLFEYQMFGWPYVMAGSVLFEYQMLGSPCALRGSVLFEYQIFGCGVAPRGAGVGSGIAWVGAAGVPAAAGACAIC
jgi:hypothetical protein